MDEIMDNSARDDSARELVLIGDTSPTNAPCTVLPYKEVVESTKNDIFIISLA